MHSSPPFNTASPLKPTVFIIDDNDAGRNALQARIESMNIPTCTFSTVQDFLYTYRPEQPGCLVLEVRPPQLSGLELQDYLQRKNIKTPVIFISEHSDVSMAVRSLKAGAIDFFEKPYNNQRLRNSIHKAFEIDRVTRIDDQWRRMVLQYLKQLSRREEEVLRLLIQGKPNKIIAHEMSLSPKTIETHRAHIMQKLGVNSLAGLVWMALTSGEYPEIPDHLPFPLPSQAPSMLSLR